MTTRTTHGRPLLAMLIMALLLALSAGFAWWVEQRKSDAPLTLGETVDVPGLPLRFRAPAGWNVESSRDPGSPVLQMQDPQTPVRVLTVVRQPGGETSDADLLADLQRLGRMEPVGRPTPCRIGPLPARQALFTVRDRKGEQQQRRIVRVALLAQGFYLVMRLDCAGPPTPGEWAIMDQLSNAAESPEAYRPLDAEQAAARMLTLSGSPAGNWLVAPAAGNGAWLPLIPHADSKLAFWGLARAAAIKVRRGTNLDDVMTQLLPANSQRAWQRELLKVGPVRGVRAVSAQANVIVQLYVAASPDEPASVLHLLVWSAPDDAKTAHAAALDLLASLRTQ